MKQSIQPQENKLTNGQLLKLRIKRFVRQWNELLIVVPVLLLVWEFLPAILRHFDARIVCYDDSYLLKLVYACLATAVEFGVVNLLIYLSFPTLHAYIYRRMENELLLDILNPHTKTNDNKKIWQRQLFSLGLLSLYILTVIANLLAI
ncbi:hypothetical protein [Flexibacter flexilis]|uniref:hypothetical protein n=1 Tax=Flexibacter flexilis TaxID=998 RepID=UPI0011607C98|nr:hypothetical protein [Flexibacter flexilis]